MDDKKVDISDDEFQFTDAEETKFSDSFEAPEPLEVEPRGGKFNRRNILIAIGVILIGGAVYKLVEVFFSSVDKKPVIPTPAVIVEQPTPAPQPQSIVTQAPVMTPEPNHLAELQANQTAMTQQITAVKDQLNSLQSTNQNLGDAITNINQQLGDLAAQMQSMQTAIKALTPAPKPAAKVKTKKIYYAAPPAWIIQAMVPGRAWLAQANGTTITVNKGDALPGYGRVTEISVVNNLVRTSSGQIIR